MNYNPERQSITFSIGEFPMDVQHALMSMTDINGSATNTSEDKFRQTVINNINKLNLLNPEELDKVKEIVHRGRLLPIHQDREKNQFGLNLKYNEYEFALDVVPGMKKSANTIPSEAELREALQNINTQMKLWREGWRNLFTELTSEYIVKGDFLPADNFEPLRQELLGKINKGSLSSSDDISLLKLLQTPSTGLSLSSRFLQLFTRKVNAELLLKQLTGLQKVAKVVKRKDGWNVLSEKGKNLGGPYKTKEEAVKRLRQVEYFKKADLPLFKKAEEISEEPFEDKPVEKSQPEKKPQVKWPSNLPALSHSSLNMYRTCPKKYRYLYVDKLREQNALPKGEMLGHFSLGKSVHNVLEYAFSDKRPNSNGGLYPPTERELHEFLDRVWISEGYEDAQAEAKAKAEAHSIISSYFVKYIENVYNKPYKVEYPFEFEIEGIPFVGQIDRLDKGEDGKFRIIDYKTGRTPFSKVKMKNNLQFMYYQMAVEKNLGPVDNLSLHNLNEDRSYNTTPYSAEDLQKLRETTVELARDIADGKFEATPDERKCNNCIYNNICKESQASKKFPYYWKGYELGQSKIAAADKEGGFMPTFPSQPLWNQRGDGRGGGADPSDRVVPLRHIQRDNPKNDPDNEEGKRDAETFWDTDTMYGHIPSKVFPKILLNLLRKMKVKPLSKKDPSMKKLAANPHASSESLGKAWTKAYRSGHIPGTKSAVVLDVGKYKLIINLITEMDKPLGYSVQFESPGHPRRTGFQIPMDELHDIDPGKFSELGESIRETLKDIIVKNNTKIQDIFDTLTSGERLSPKQEIARHLLANNYAGALALMTAHTIEEGREDLVMEYGKYLAKTVQYEKLLKLWHNEGLQLKHKTGKDLEFLSGHLPFNTQWEGVEYKSDKELFWYNINKMFGLVGGKNAPEGSYIGKIKAIEAVRSQGDREGADRLLSLLPEQPINIQVNMVESLGSFGKGRGTAMDTALADVLNNKSLDKWPRITSLDILAKTYGGRAGLEASPEAFAAVRDILLDVANDPKDIPELQQGAIKHLMNPTTGFLPWTTEKKLLVEKEPSEEERRKVPGEVTEWPEELTDLVQTNLDYDTRKTIYNNLLKYVTPKLLTRYSPESGPVWDEKLDENLAKVLNKGFQSQPGIKELLLRHFGLASEKPEGLKWHNVEEWERGQDLTEEEVQKELPFDIKESKPLGKREIVSRQPPTTWPTGNGTYPWGFGSAVPLSPRDDGLLLSPYPRQFFGRPKGKLWERLNDLWKVITKAPEEKPVERKPSTAYAAQEDTPKEEFANDKDAEDSLKSSVPAEINRAVDYFGRKGNKEMLIAATKEAVAYDNTLYKILDYATQHQFKEVPAAILAGPGWIQPKRYPQRGEAYPDLPELEITPRIKAAQLSAHLGDTDTMQKALSDKDYGVKDTAIAYFANAGNSDMLIRMWWETTDRVILQRIITHIGDKQENVAFLEQALKASKKEVPTIVREQIISMLGFHQRFDSLKEYLKTEDDPKLKAKIEDILTTHREMPAHTGFHRKPEESQRRHLAELYSMALQGFDQWKNYKDIRKKVTSYFKYSRRTADRKQSFETWQKDQDQIDKLINDEMNKLPSQSEAEDALREISTLIKEIKSIGSSEMSNELIEVLRYARDIQEDLETYKRAAADRLNKMDQYEKERGMTGKLHSWEKYKLYEEATGTDDNLNLAKGRRQKAYDQALFKEEEVLNKALKDVTKKFENYVTSAGLPLRSTELSTALGELTELRLMYVYESGANDKELADIVRENVKTISNKDIRLLINKAKERSNTENPKSDVNEFEKLPTDIKELVNSLKWIEPMWQIPQRKKRNLYNLEEGYRLVAPGWIRTRSVREQMEEAEKKYHRAQNQYYKLLLPQLRQKLDPNVATQAQAVFKDRQDKLKNLLKIKDNRQRLAVDPIKGDDYTKQYKELKGFEKQLREKLTNIAREIQKLPPDKEVEIEELRKKKKLYASLFNEIFGYRPIPGSSLSDYKKKGLEPLRAESIEQFMQDTWR